MEVANMTMSARLDSLNVNSPDGFRLQNVLRELREMLQGMNRPGRWVFDLELFSLILWMSLNSFFFFVCDFKCFFKYKVFHWVLGWRL